MQANESRDNKENKALNPQVQIGKIKQNEFSFLRFLYVLSRYPDGLEMREESGLEMKTHL
jgi:hypothetical protein